ncbi:MAG: glycosyltransferase family 2 protein [Bacillota bacterium]|nr:glycosyltransferase family 2 protein [Bacillota bacterium]
MLQVRRLDLGQPTVAIIVLNWNAAVDTLECLSSLVRSEYRNCSIVVVDNGSTDGSIDLIQSRFPQVTILKNSSNLGYAEGNNRGIAYALTKGAQYIWLLNNDTVVDPMALTKLVEAAETHPQAAFIGSTIRFYNSEVIWYGGARINWWTGVTEHIGLGQRTLRQTNCEIFSTEYVTGCSLLARSKAIEEIGLLDEKLFLYYEDVDWSIRARRAGWELVQATKSVIWHKVSSSSKSTSNFVAYYCVRNRLYFLAKHSPCSLWIAVPYNFVRFILPSLLRGRRQQARAMLQGMIHFFQGKMGQGVGVS